MNLNATPPPPKPPRMYIQNGVSRLCLSGLNGEASLVYEYDCKPSAADRYSPLPWQLWTLEPASGPSVGRAARGAAGVYQIKLVGGGWCMQVGRPGGPGRASAAGGGRVPALGPRLRSLSVEVVWWGKSSPARPPTCCYPLTLTPSPRHPITPPGLGRAL
jgi:hypothetical protein